jgi:hypothetical protein
MQMYNIIPPISLQILSTTGKMFEEVIKNSPKAHRSSEFRVRFPALSDLFILFNVL